MKFSQKLSALTLSFSLFSSIAFAQNVGIGEANPASKLTVNGNLSVGFPTDAAPVDGAIIKGQTTIGYPEPLFGSDMLSVFSLNGNYGVNSFVYNGIRSTTGASASLNTAALYGYVEGDGGLGLLVDHETTYDFGGVVNSYALYGNAAFKGDSESINAHGVMGEVPNGANGYAIYANGDLYYAGGAYSPSDVNLKQNITSYTSGLSTIMALSPKLYEFKPDLAKKYNFTEAKQIGFLAQDLKTVMPELVRTSNILSTSTTSRDAKKHTEPEQMTIETVNYTGLIPVMTSAIQEQQVQIESLKKENELMKAQLEILMQEVQALKQAK